MKFSKFMSTAKQMVHEKCPTIIDDGILPIDDGILLLGDGIFLLGLFVHDG